MAATTKTATDELTKAKEENVQETQERRRGGDRRSTSGKTRVVIVDGHTLFRRGVRNILELEADIEVVGEAGSGREAIATVEELTPDEKASVLRIVQEALQNVRKHSAATQVRIGIENGHLVIVDNGRGFDVMRLASGATRNFGLHFMRERAELMETTLSIESRQGEGTRILLRLPEH